MKLLINICAHDGIISHNAGVGTMVKRYIEVFCKNLKLKEINFHLNLITPEYNVGGFGYSELTKMENESNPNISIYCVPNGTNGKKFFGNLDNWKELSYNTAKIINSINFETYDCVITLLNDTPFAGVLELAKDDKKHLKIWIPHSTAKIHLPNIADINTQKRIEWEYFYINYVNSHENAYVAAIGKYIKEHLINCYYLKKEKCLWLPNGEILSSKTIYEENDECAKLFENVKKYDEIILSYGRPEEYKNLDSSMRVSRLLGIKTVVVTQEYYNGMEYVDYLKKLALETDSDLYINAPFNFPQYILNHYEKKIIMLIPSKKEIAGLLVNEIRKMNKNNILLVANDIDGIKEQIDDGVDGVLVDLNNLKKAAIKIKKYYNKECMKKLNQKSQETLHTKYDFERTCDDFLENVLNNIEVVKHGRI